MGANEGEAQERTCIYMSSRTEGFRLAQEIGTGLDEAGVAREDSVAAEFREVCPMLALAEGAIDAVDC